MAGSMIFGASKPKKPGMPPAEGAPEEFGAGEDMELASMAGEEIDVYSETEAEAEKVLVGKLGSEGVAALKAYIDSCLAKKQSEPTIPVE